MYIIMGLGISSKAVIKKFKELKKKFIILVNRDEISKASEFCESVISYDMVKYINLDKIKYVIKSPGIPYYDNTVKYLIKNNIKIINEIELTYLLSGKLGKYIGVSGSVGKSSVVTLLHYLIKYNTKNVILAGNIGDPLINYLDNINKDTIIILEISSFQLDDFNQMKLDIALLLNIIDNHLDFYKTKKDYYLSKFKLTNNQTKHDCFIVNLDDYNTKKYLLNHCFKSKLIDYKLGFNIVHDVLYYWNDKILNLKDFPLIGEHNLDNLKAVISVLNVLNIEANYKMLKKFEPLEYHLNELIINNITIVNDSKSTSIASVKSALNSYRDRKIILLFGGYNKNLDFSFINEYNLKYAICFGKLSNEIDSKVRYNIKFDNLKEACKFALSIASEEDVVLFSPGCASFDEYKSYIERGKSFDNYVKEYFYE